MKSEQDHHATEVNDALIVRYLAGEAGPEEALALQDLLDDSTFKNRFEEMQAAWHDAHPRKKPRAVDMDSSWKKLNETVADTSRSGNTVPLWRSNFLLKIAASVAFLMLSSVWVYRIVFNEQAPLTLATGSFSKQVALSDQSVVTLYHQTSLSYPEKFDDDVREVTLLEGEAFFSVTPNREKPFIIHTTLGDIRVVGTAFNVVLERDQLKIEVKEGKVSVSTSEDSGMIEAGHSALVQPSASRIHISDSVHSNAWAYATGKFNFEDAPLYEVVSDIEKVFPYRIRLQTSTIRNCRLTAAFDHVSIEKMLNLTAESLNLTVVRNGAEFILEGEGCP